LAQSVATDPALTTMFDVGYSLTCRDAAMSVGKLYKLRDPGAAQTRLAAVRADTATCSAPRQEQLAGPGAVLVTDGCL
jgi:hypothetical protein